ncbi:MAG: gliding motility-associated-like protein [Saprospiraceae bacterium]|jgi:gliding motility-associated-like protein
MRILVIIGMLLCTVNVLSGQGSLVSEFTMDQCNLQDDFGFLSGQVFGSDPCACGVKANGLEFDGISDFANFDDEIKAVLQEDWTMTFYVKFDNRGDETVDLMFLGENCGRDSVFSVRYFASSGRFRVRLSDSPGNEVQVDGASDPNACWQYVAIVKEGSILTLYINGELAEQASSVSALRLEVGGRLTIGNGPCLSSPSNPDARFDGTIDELRIYNSPLTQLEIVGSDYRPDQILNRDTTIFEGGSVLLQTGGSCSDDFTWSPTATLSDPNRLDPVATPLETTTYTLDIEENGCRVTNNVKISVVSDEEITCDDLRLPSAFTPNDDRINDRYEISNGFLIENLNRFEIFNRWGSRVFFSPDAAGSWDGIYKGAPAPSTSYVYLVDYTCEGQDYRKTGTLHLIR